MSTVVKGFEALSGSSVGPNTLILKGAPERVIEKCRNYKKEDGSVQDFSDVEKKRLIE